LTGWIFGLRVVVVPLPLAVQRKAVRARLTQVFGPEYGSFTVRLSRLRKHEPRVVVVEWMVFPFEGTVLEALGDLASDNVVCRRGQWWSCGNLHDDGMEAWKAHEGAGLLVSPESDCCGGLCSADELILPDDVAEALRADGETFVSECRPGNFAHCPTCGGGAHIYESTPTRAVPCPDCERLGLDRAPFVGVLDLDNPEHYTFYAEAIDQAATRRTSQEAKAEHKRARALTVAATHTKAQFEPLPTRGAGLLNGYPVAERVGCDVLLNPDDAERRHRCLNDATHFEPTSGLRVCTVHRRGTAQSPNP
jgi:hypothetical protein